MTPEFDRTERLLRAILGLVALVSGPLALATLYPVAAGAGNLFGYRSFCPFAPTSTLAVAVAGFMAWHARSKVGQDPEDGYR